MMETIEDLKTELNEEIMILKRTHDEMKEQLNISVRKLLEITGSLHP